MTLMSEPKEVKVRYSATKSLWMVLGVMVLLALCALLNVSLFDSLENQLIDFRFNVRGERAPQVPIRVIAVDDKSLQEIGRWPWPRAVHAELARKLKDYGVQYTFFDVIFSEPERDPSKAILDQLGKSVGRSSTGKDGGLRESRDTEERLLREIRKFQGTETGDEKLARALRDTNNVFLPVAPMVQVEGQDESDSEEGTAPDLAGLYCSPAKFEESGYSEFEEANSLLAAIPNLRKAMLDSGHIRYRPNQDGVLRNYPVVIRYKDAYLPQIAVQMSRYVLNVQNEPLTVVGNQYALLAGRKIPLEVGGYSYINFCGGNEVFPFVSACDVLSGKADAGLLKGSVAVIGATADGLSDIRAIPFVKAYPGVQINANILENIVANQFLNQAFPQLTYLLIILMALIMWFLVPRVSPWAAILWFAGLLAAYVAVACVLFAFNNLIVNMIYPLSALILAYTFLTAYKFRTEVKHSRYMKQMFQSMVAPSVVEEILKLPSGIELGGEEKELTVMFSDIRGFTTYSEKHSPHEVVGLLNEYLTQMTYLVFQTEGTLDKYIGDAIMAFWGAPAPQQDHAFRACSTALGMVDLLKGILHKKWELEGREKLRIGIGLNTGRMVVGFVGSEHMKNYTLIGDAVNLGSRLEGATKQYKVDIVIGEATYDSVKADMLCRELDLIRVKGKQEPIRIFELVGYRSKVAGTNKELKAKAFEEGLAEYRARRFEEAVRRFRNCLDLDAEDGPSAVFTERCALLKDHPPPADWDGVFVMKTK